MHTNTYTLTGHISVSSNRVPAVTPETHVINGSDISLEIESGNDLIHEAEDDSASHYDKSNRDLLLHRYSYRNAKPANSDECQLNDRYAETDIIRISGARSCLYSAKILLK